MLETYREDRYRDILKTPEKCELLRQIWRDAYGEDYPDDADPFGFVTVSDLNSIAAELELAAGSALLDVGCGRGGPGLWIARKTGCILTGIDILAEAIEQANVRKERLGMTNTARFALGTFSNTGMPASSQQAIMSVDVFWMVLDKAAAIAEMARILAPGGRLAMTTWTPREPELAETMHTAGLRVLLWAETAFWKERQMNVYRGIMRNRAELERQMGTLATAVLVAEAREAPARLPAAPRRLIVVERKL
jgi:ubiquinone/menaquinone biosynthesis C-methylase UbiE